MADPWTPTLRSVKGSPLTHNEVDANFNGLNNKLERSEDTTTSTSSLTPDSAKLMCSVTALADSMTINAPSGSPTDGWPILLRIKDNGTARGLTWNTIWRSIGFTLPSATVLSKTLYLLAVYNSADSKWDVIDYVKES